MIIKKHDPVYNFFSWFDTETGFYARTDILDEHNKGTGVDPFMTRFPELIDVGIMGHCTHGKTGLCIQSGVQCYQNGLNVNKPNMTLSDYKKIIDEGKGKLFQVALGGCGDPDQHENFEEILKYTRENNIVPNFTSSGLGFNKRIVELCKEYCGAVAVSFYRHEYTFRAIDMLLTAGVKTNIHYVLGNNSIGEAITRIKKNDFPEGINAVIFLLHKPVGLGQQSNVLKTDSDKVKEFFDAIENCEHDFKIGFDSCTIPGIINYTTKIDPNSIDTCEGGRWSMYITSDMKALPCSFDNQDLRWAYDISNATIQEAWDSDVFDDFRNHFRKSCPNCKNREQCMGGCPIRNEVVLCDRKERKN